MAEGEGGAEGRHQRRAEERPQVCVQEDQVPRMYFTSLDGVHVTAWYDPDIDGMEVIKIKLEDKEEVIKDKEET